MLRARSDALTRGLVMIGQKGVVAFAFGVPYTTQANRQIRDIAARGSAPIFTQQDIQFPDIWNMDVTYCEEKVGEPPPTLRIAREAVRWAIKMGIDQITVVAAQPHLSRAMRDMKMAVREWGANILVVKSREVGLYHEDSWYSPESTQARARSARAFLPREYILRLMPRWLYKKLAS